MNVTAIHPKHTDCPKQHQIEALQAAYEAMPEADQNEAVYVFLEMVTAGAKAVRKEQ